MNNTINRVNQSNIGFGMNLKYGEGIDSLVTEFPQIQEGAKRAKDVIEKMEPFCDVLIKEGPSIKGLKTILLSLPEKDVPLAAEDLTSKPETVATDFPLGIEIYLKNSARKLSQEYKKFVEVEREALREGFIEPTFIKMG